MKLKIMSLAFLAAFSVSSLYAGNSLDLKIGAGSQTVDVAGTETTNWGFDGALGFNILLDKLFAIAPEVGFLTYSNTGASVKTSTYLIPMTLNAKLFIPMGDSDFEEKPLIQPYINVGGGYLYGITTTDKAGTSSQLGLSGFTYQVLLGTAITLDPTSAVQVLVEGGYRGFNSKSDKAGATAVDSYGFIARVGVRYSFDGAVTY